MPDTPLPNRLLPMLGFFIRRHAGGMVPLLILPMMNAAVTASYSNATRHITNAVLEAEKSGGDLQNAAIKPLKFFIFLVCSTLIVRMAQWIASYYTRPRFMADIRRTLFAYIQRHDAVYFETNLSGKIAHKAATLPDLLRAVTERCCFDLFPAIGFFAISMFYFATARPLFAVLIAGWLAIYLGVTGAMARYAARASSHHNEAKTQLTGRMVDTITNIKNVIASAAHGEEDRVIGNAIRETKHRHRASYFTIVQLRFVQQSLSIVMWITLYSVAIHSWVNHRINAGDFVLITTLGGLLISRAQDVGDMMPDFIDDIGSAMESIETLVVPRRLLDAPNAQPLKIAQGEIAFDHVRFHYPDGAKVFDDLSLTIEPGQRVGLIGSSGAGKTTLTTLLLRLQDVDGGSISIDRQNIAKATQQSLRSQIGLIPQDTVLFYRSLMDNIRYGCPQATDDEVIEAARLAHADDFITALPQGYRTLVGERGVKLSGGQRQRISIARALLKQAPILILDEATSALDSESEALIQNAMAVAMKGRTVIAIAHRLSTINHLDRLIVLENGRVVEDGPHAELLKQNGLYARLWQRQSGGFLKDDDEAAPSLTEPADLPPAAKRDPQPDEKQPNHDE